jgi:hypothetical protein
MLVRTICCQRRSNRCSLHKPVEPLFLYFSSLTTTIRFFLFSSFTRILSFILRTHTSRRRQRRRRRDFPPLSSYVKRKTREGKEKNRRETLMNNVLLFLDWSALLQILSPDRHTQQSIKFHEQNQ